MKALDTNKWNYIIVIRWLLNYNHISRKNMWQNCYTTISLWPTTNSAAKISASFTGFKICNNKKLQSFWGVKRKFKQKKLFVFWGCDMKRSVLPFFGQQIITSFVSKQASKSQNVKKKKIFMICDKMKCVMRWNKVKYYNYENWKDSWGRRHSVQMSLACVLSLALFWLLLQSWELCLVFGIVRYIVLSPWW